ncbi:MAG: hypothetical protein IKA56_06355 [Clostridia bacterium]|nr:hypothetical protein [Clostridia bacterium]
MDRKRLKSELSKYYDSENLINYTIKIIDEFDADIRNELFTYLETGKMSDYVANGWTIKQVHDKLQEDIIEAFITFDKIKKHSWYANGFKFYVAGRK